MEILDEIEVEYITLPGWMTSINHCRTFNELPANAQAYIRKIEEITEIPGERLSVMLSQLLLCYICCIEISLCYTRFMDARTQKQL